MPITPFPVSGLVYGIDSTTVQNAATVNVIYHGEKLTTTTNASGQYIVDLANLPSGTTYANGERFRIEAYTTNRYTATTAVVDTALGFTDQNLTLENVTTNNMFTLAQKVVYNILNSDNMISYFGANLKDQIPADLARGAGFPYIIVNTATNSEERFTNGPNRKFADEIFVEVEIYSKIQKNIREVADAIRSALVNNQATTKTTRLYWMRVARTSIGHEFYAGEETYPIWKMIMMVQFDWRGL